MQTLIHQSIELGATRHPDRIAFRCRSEALTYRALYLRACQLANFLRSRGLKPNDRVGIHMPKSIELPFAVYGILLAGGAYVPVDATAPPNRVEFILKDCGIRFLITSKEKLHTVKSLEASDGLPLETIVGIEREDTINREYVAWKNVYEAETTRPVERATEGDLAYIMYTSGSTGIPKGLMHTHRSGLSYARFSSELYGVSGSDILGNHAPLHFDISTFEFLTGPYVGATSVLVPEEEIMFPVSLAKFVEKEKLTFWYSVPLALIQLLTRGEIESVDLSSLRWVLFAGEPFPPKHLEALMQYLPGAKFSNVYGPAEVNQCTFYHVPQNFTADEGSVPIGEIWPGAKGIVIDANGQQTEGAALGELLISSPTMMKGYWNRPDLNENAFATYELTPGSPQVFYRTGDLVFRNQQGELMFSGRKDRQVKIRGYRIELDEIEAALTSYDSIEESAVFVVPGHDEVKRLVAAVSIRDGFDYDGKAIIDFLRKNLPPYSIPENIAVVPDFPRTTSGKIDRNQLARSNRVES